MAAVDWIDNHYYAARNTSVKPVRVKRGSDRDEKLLFYHGAIVDLHAGLLDDPADQPCRLVR